MPSPSQTPYINNSPDANQPVPSAASSPTQNQSAINGQTDPLTGSPVPGSNANLIPIPPSPNANQAAITGKTDPLATPVSNDKMTLGDILLMANKALLGLPEAGPYILDSLGLVPKGQTQDFQQLRNENPGYEGYENAGTLLSGIVNPVHVPGVSLGKPAAEAISQAASKSSPIAKWLGGVAGNAAGGAIDTGVLGAGQQAIRTSANGITGQDGGFNPESIPEAGLFAAGIGGLLHGVGASLPKGKPLTSGEVATAQKMASGQLPSSSSIDPATNQVNPPDPIAKPIMDAATRTVNNLSASQNGGLLNDFINPVRGAIDFQQNIVKSAKTISDYGIDPNNISETLTNASNSIKNKLDTIDSIAQQGGHLPKVQAAMSDPKVLEGAITSIKNSTIDPTLGDTMAAYVGKVYDDTMAAFNTGNIGQVRSQLSTGMNNLAGQLKNNGAVLPAYSALQKIRNVFNDQMAQIPEIASNPSLARAPADYGILQDIGQASILGQSSKAAAANPGPATSLGGIASTHPVTLGRKVAMPFLNKIDSLIQPSFSDSVNSVASKTAGDYTGGKIGNSLQSIANPIAGSQAAANESNDTAEAPAGSLQTDLYDNNGDYTQMMHKLTDALEARNQKQQMQKGQSLVPELSDAQTAALNREIFPDNTGKPDMMALGNTLFDTDSDKEAFKKAGESYNQIIPNIREAYKSSHGIIPNNAPVLGKLNTDAANIATAVSANSNAPVSARNAVVKGLQDFTGNQDPYFAQEAISNSTSPKDLERRILDSMKSNPTKYQLLQRAGLVP